VPPSDSIGLLRRGTEKAMDGVTGALVEIWDRLELELAA